MKTSLFSQKSDYLRKKLINTQNLFFYNFEMVKIQRKIWIWCKLLCCSYQKNGTNTNKTVFLLNMSHIELNYSILLFWSIFGEIYWKCLFFYQKLLTKKEAQNFQKLWFAQQFKKEQIQLKIWILYKQLILVKPVKMDKY